MRQQCVILGNVDLVRRCDLPVEERSFLLENVHIAARRASDLVSQIMKFSRKNDQQDEMIHLPDLLQEVLKLLKSTIPSSVIMQLNLPEENKGYFVKANAGKVQDIILNLCSNAVYAMEEHGQLTIALDYILENLMDKGAANDQKNRIYACIEVTDTGCGMDQDLLGKIFEPFFTTKDAQHGTGLGLSTIKNTVEQYSGRLQVESQVGTGTTFRVFLPAGIADDLYSATLADTIFSGTEKIGSVSFRVG